MPGRTPVGQTDPMRAPLAAIGGGTMGQAIVLGAIDAGVLDPSRVCVADPDAAKLGCFARVGVRVAGSAGEAMAWMAERERDGACVGEVLLAVKPQSLDGAGAELAGSWGSGERVVISILAGAGGARVRAAVGGRARVVRAMPNTPARIARGATGVALTDSSRPGDDANARLVLSAVGEVIPVPEDLLDAFTAIAGSGPAYLFYLAEAMIQAGVASGMPHDVASRAVVATLAGSGELLARDGEGGRLPDPVALRAAVSSRGGTTLAATGVLDDAGVKAIIARAVEAGVARARELAR